MKKYRLLFRKRKSKKEAIERTRKEAGLESKRRTRRRIRKARNSKVRNGQKRSERFFIDFTVVATWNLVVLERPR